MKGHLIVEEVIVDEATADVFSDSIRLILMIF
jgi:hypothetical protein